MTAATLFEAAGGLALPQPLRGYLPGPFEALPWRMLSRYASANASQLHI